MLRCKHCLIPIFDKEAVYGNDQSDVFCCEGCRSVYELINSEGLGRFYRERKWEQDTIGGKELFKKVDARLFNDLIITNPDGTLSLDLFVDNIRCASCVWLIEKILSRTKGIVSIKINYATHRAHIKWRPQELSLEELLNKISSLGYTPKPFSESEQLKQQRAHAKDLLIRFGTAGFLSSQLMVYTIALYAGYFQDIDRETKVVLEVIALVLTTPVVFYCGLPFIRNTLIGLRSLHLTMDTLIAVGSVSAYVFSIYQLIIGGKVYFDTAAMIVTLILLGRYIEANAKINASQTLQRLTELFPEEARLIKEGPDNYEMVPISLLKVGDRIRILPGERIPIDSTVIEGETETDESFITGESQPIHKTPGSTVVGGSINLNGSIIAEVAKPLKETVLSGIIEAVKEAQSRLPRIQTVADRVVAVFVPVIFVLASITVVFHIHKGVPLQEAIMTGISVIVIACPCSLGLATPLAVLLSTLMATSKGLLIKGGDIIEKTQAIDTVVFDKTGTLTEGRPHLKETILSGDTDLQEVLAIAGSLEKHSEHSLAKAIVDASRGLTYHEVSSVKVIPGKGIRGLVDKKVVCIGNAKFIKEEGMSIKDDLKEKLQSCSKSDTIVFIGWDSLVKAVFLITDRIREDAGSTVEALNKLGLSLYMLTGDNQITAKTIADQVGIKNVIAEATPLDKHNFIKELQSKGKKVLMIGDGINDALSLTEAYVGVSMVKGTEIAIESAEVVLVREHLRLIVTLIELSKRTYRIIKENVFMSFLYNVTAIPIAMAGLLHPIIAAAAMAASSLCVVGNSLRIRRL